MQVNRQAGVVFLLLILGFLLFKFIGQEKSNENKDGKYLNEKANVENGWGDERVLAPDENQEKAAPVKSVELVVNGAKWTEAMALVHTQSRYQILHRASVTGRVSDIAAARRIEKICSKFLLGSAYYKSIGVNLTQAQENRIKEERERCDNPSQAASSKITIRDDEGLGELAGTLAELSGGAVIKDKALQEKLLAAVFDSKSVELLEAVSRSLLTSTNAYNAGLSRDPEIPAQVDDALLDLAVQIAACSKREDCERAAGNNIECAAFNACVENLLSFPSKKIFGPKEERARIFKDVNASDDRLANRWRAVSSFIDEKTGNRR